MSKTIRTGLAALALACLAQSAQAEVATVTIGIQNGVAYLPFHVMAAQRLVEKHGKKLGVSITANVRNLSTTGFVRDALIAGQIQFGVAGSPTLITLHDKTRGEYSAASAVVSIPIYINTTNPKIKSICDFTDGDKIAVPTVKSSGQAVILQMASKQRCGDPFRNDRFTISMAHPDAYNALLSGLISTHIASPPFSSGELERGKGKVRTVLSAYDILKSKATTVFLISSNTFRTTNPKVYRAVREALEESEFYIRAHPKEAAAIYIKAEKSTLREAAIIAQITSPDVVYSTTPAGLSPFADFMFGIGTVKTKYNWQDLSMPELRGRKGS